MELKRCFDFRRFFVILYAVVFGVYIMVGLQPAGAATYDATTELVIPSIGLVSGVAKVKLDDSGFETPEAIVGSYQRAQNKTLLFGHSTTVFRELEKVEIGEMFNYAGETYQIQTKETLPKSEIDMNKLLKKEDEDTIVLMTCAGELLDGGDATHRLIMTATKVTN